VPAYAQVATLLKKEKIGVAKLSAIENEEVLLID
jgi:hypothetical protein